MCRSKSSDDAEPRPRRILGNAASAGRRGHHRWRHCRGDGVLLEFPSIVAAVECALAVQKPMAERNAEVPQDRQMRFRIGINLGDVLIEDDDILGDGVTIAARLEAIAEPRRRWALPCHNRSSPAPTR